MSAPRAPPNTGTCLPKMDLPTGTKQRSRSPTKLRALGPAVPVALAALIVGMLTLVSAWAQQGGAITGTVTDGDPLPGVNVLVEGTEQGTATDASGDYSITAWRPASTRRAPRRRAAPSNRFPGGGSACSA